MAEFAAQYRGGDAEGRIDAPAFHRNHEPIWSVLGPFIQAGRGNVLEIGSGTGQHAVTFAARAPNVIWWPSDYQDDHLRSIDAWRRTSGLTNVMPPLRIDASAADWNLPPALQGEGALAIFSANVLHIAAWRVAEGLLAGAGRHLRADGRLFIYGPFMRGGRHTAPSNERFDASLRAENPDWGVRDVDALAAAGTRQQLHLTDLVSMPANNFVLIFERTQ